MTKSKWEKSKFQKKIRITGEDLEFIRMYRSKKSLAGKLHEIINKYRKETKITDSKIK